MSKIPILELVDQAARGEGPGVGALVNRMLPIIQVRAARTLLRRGIGTKEVRIEVEDMVQEVLMSLFAEDGRVLRNWDAERGLSFDNYVGLVAERRVAALLRSGKRRGWREEATEPEDLAQQQSQSPDTERRTASRQSLVRLLSRLRGELSPLGWRMFRWIYIEEQSVEEICRLADMTSDAVYAWKSRLRKRSLKLRDALESESRA